MFLFSMVRGHAGYNCKDGLHILLLIRIPREVLMSSATPVVVFTV